MTSDDLFDALHRVQSATGIDARAIALKAQVPLEPVAKFLEEQCELDPDVATKLAEYAETALDNPIGLVLLMLREATGLSHAEVMAETGLNRYSISKWERGDRQPQHNAMMALWHFYNAQLEGVELAWILGGDIDATRAFLEARS